ncbi:MAG: family 20 glycosylhydrolase [Ginsengibacter sp.]
MKSYFLILSVLLSTSILAQKINIVPQPAELKMPKIAATFSITKNTTIILKGNGLEKSADFFNSYLRKYYGFALKMSNDSSSRNAVVLSLKSDDSAVAGGYTMTVSDNEVYITGNDEAGTFYGVQTLIQLLPLKKSAVLSIPYISIKDYPRFQYRGMHLDVGRHFFPADYIKKYIDYLALYKYNSFHWHLTEDQGWRIEIKKYPKLTSVGGFRNGTIIGHHPGKGNTNERYGGFYTQEEIKEVVKYAADRYITIIPEIEMPGHSSAAIAAYPQLSCFPDESTKISSRTPWAGSRDGKQVQQTWGVFEDVFCPSDYTFTFLEDVLDEVMDLFPSKYIHIGGDECPKAAWKRSEFCQQLIKDSNLKDEHGLQSYFISKIEKYLNSKGRNIIGWDEILEGGLAQNATVMSWRGEEGGIAAAKQQHNVIMTPDKYCYLNYSQTKNEDSLTIGGYLPLSMVYNYDPVPKELKAMESKYVLGAQGNVWTEYINNSSRLEYMIFPRMAALSEVLWTPKEKRNWSDFSARLPATLERYKLWGTKYSTAAFDVQSSILPSEEHNGILWKLETNNVDSKIIYVKGRSTNASFNYSQPVLINASGTYGAVATGRNNEILNGWTWKTFSFNKATGKKITLKNQPDLKYQGSGAFTLVNGIIADKGLAEPIEWLGFAGTDLEADIDLGESVKIKSVSLNVLDDNESWIYLPKEIQVATSYNGQNYSSIATMAIDGIKDKGKSKFTLPVNTTTRFLKVLAQNSGTIPFGAPGAGTPAWLFASEIEVN